MSSSSSKNIPLKMSNHIPPNSSTQHTPGPFASTRIKSCQIFIAPSLTTWPGPTVSSSLRRRNVPLHNQIIGALQSTRSCRRQSFWKFRTPPCQLLLFTNHPRRPCLMINVELNLKFSTPTTPLPPQFLLLLSSLKFFSNGGGGGRLHNQHGCESCRFRWSQKDEIPRTADY